MSERASESDWPFNAPRNLGVITTKSIVQDGKAILSAFHDEEGDWQFLDGGATRAEDVLIVSLARIVTLDPSLLQLAGLPPGWQAWRATPTTPWQRAELK